MRLPGHSFAGEPCATDADSDDDGLSDGAEVMTYHTNAKDGDSDDDGKADGAEVSASTDPMAK